MYYLLCGDRLASVARSLSTNNLCSDSENVGKVCSSFPTNVESKAHSVCFFS